MLKWMHGPQAEFEHFAPGIKAGLLEQAQECITAFKAEGFVVVPVRPNYDMGEAGMGALASFHDEHPAACVDEIYRAMLSAATTGENDANDR